MALSPPFAIGSALPQAGRKQERPRLTGQLLRLAWSSCPECFGTGGETIGSACGCVHEAIFRECYRRYRSCQTGEVRGWRHKSLEFIADFESIARRAVGAAWPLFRRHFVLGDPRVDPRASRTLMRVAGRAFRETQPYPLFPVHDYFGEPVSTWRPKAGSQ